MSIERRKTIISQLQEYLEKGNRIDVDQFAMMFQSTSLPTHIRGLKKKGLNIKQGKKDGTNYTEYWIED